MTVNGMLYQRGSFTVPATGKTIISCDAGHAMPDIKGRCVRCGEQVAPTHGVISNNPQTNKRFQLDGLAKR